jgi:hypothetical protein
MRWTSPILLAMQLFVLLGCASPTPQPPRLEGAVGSVSREDIRKAVTLVEQWMKRQSGRVFPIERVRVNSRNEIEVVYHQGDQEIWAPVLRVHGVWTPPLDTNVYVTG